MQISDKAANLFDSAVFDEIASQSISFLIGAGVSKSAGIPLATEIVSAIQSNFPTEEDDYYALMETIGEQKRRELFFKYDADSKINPSSLYLALLLKEGIVKSVLTTNFDSLIPRASSLMLEQLRIYDATFSPNKKSVTPYFPSLTYLHGQAHGFWQLNAIAEHLEYKATVKDFLLQGTKNTNLVVLGYSGLDLLFETFIEVANQSNKVYWVCYRNNFPSNEVSSKLSQLENFEYIKSNYDSDLFLYEFAKHHGTANFLDNEIFKKTLEKISDTYSKIKFDTSGDVDILENAKRKFAKAKDYVEDNAIRATNTGIRQSNITVASWLQSLNSLAKDSVANYVLLESAKKFVDEYTYFLRDYSREIQSPSISLLFLDWIDFLKVKSEDAFKRHILTNTVANAEYARLTNDLSYLRKAISFVEIGLHSSPEDQQSSLLSVKALILCDLARRTNAPEESQELYEAAIDIYQKIAPIESTDHKKMNNHASALIDFFAINSDLKSLDTALALAARAENTCYGSGAYNIAVIHNLRGDVEKTISWLRKALDSRRHTLNQVMCDPDFETLKNSDAFASLIKSFEENAGISI